MNIPKSINQMSTERTRNLKKAVQSAPRELSSVRGIIFTETFKENEGKPLLAVRRAAYRRLLENLPINIYYDELIVGGLTEKRRGAFLSPETSIEGISIGSRVNQPVKRTLAKITNTLAPVVSSLNTFAGMQLSSAWMLFNMKLDNPTNRSSQRFKIGDEEQGDIQKTIIPYWKKKNAYGHYRKNLSKKELTLMNQYAYTAEHAFGGGVFLFHPNFERAITNGLNSVIREIDDLNETNPSEFYASSADACRAVIGYAARCADRAEAMAERCECPERGAELRNIARICRRVPAESPRTFHEALQSLWFVYIALANDDCGHEIPFGRWDQLLYPYYDEDITQGRITRGQALELIECFILKTNEIEFLLHNGASLFEDGNSGRITLTIGGVDRYGNDATNEVSYLFLEALSNCRMIQPNPAVRLHIKTPEKFIDQVAEIMASGANTVQVFNDETVIKGFVDNGFPADEARDYIISGCVQQIPRSTYGSVCAAHLALPRTLELFLRKPGEYASYGDFYDSYQAYLSSIIKSITVTLGKVDQSHKDYLPNTFTSALMDGTMKSGMDVKAGGSKNNMTGISLLGLGTLTDSLEAIKTAVYEKERFTLIEMKTMLRKNFKGHEPERQYLLNKVAKYGNDDDRVDSIARDITTFCSSEASKYVTFRKGRHSIGVHSENGHVVFGFVTGATPDGRKQTEPYSIGAGSARGNEKRGYTATLKSVSKLDMSKIISGVSVNLRFNPALFDSPEKVRRFTDMIRSYFFDYNGQNLQATVIDGATLRRAQEDPSRYQDLLVRISGYSARFTELTKETQNEVISRTEYDS